MDFEARHLDFETRVNFGSFYTPPHLVAKVYEMIEKNVPETGKYVFLDTSCGYGNFLDGINSIGADIDEEALLFARKQNEKISFFNHNSLKNVCRHSYGLNENSQIIIVGNPPYNDTTSQIRNSMKSKKTDIDFDLKSRDLGLSFLLSYDKLQPNFICVLHPLSYLIKEANFNALKNFTKNYILKDGVIVSSGDFVKTSKTVQFPIIIAFYEKNSYGMDYSYIKKYRFKTEDGKKFAINDFDSIGNYVSKYPNFTSVEKNDAVAYFYTMRDINALKRAKTFLENEINNSLRVVEENFAYYCYVDVFKEYIKNLPYYFGNSDVFINIDEFLKIKNCFVEKSVSKYDFLSKKIKKTVDKNTNFAINGYFRNLFGEHYVN
ncbi:MAG: Eco57I restriction-modification methylase domain-containing protein [Chitinispirillales bacterium]|jgi:hypothetical protein|nr:Eco57I restriction-modification methylase domain-containing protein [Chitinispirillales bacterium]